MATVPFEGLPESPEPFYYYSRLNRIERRFVDALVSTGDFYFAAKEAGLERPTKGYHDLLLEPKIRCAIREKQHAETELSTVHASEIRRELRQMNDADTTEISGVRKVPCRHCWGIDGMFQYTDPELRYIEQAYSYGENNWPLACVTKEFGPEIFQHAYAAYEAAKARKTIDIKGHGGYSRNRDVNQNCFQCHGEGIPLVYVCDTRKISPGARKLIKSVKAGTNGVEILTVDQQRVREILARDAHVGIERKEVAFTLPRTPEEFQRAIESMPIRELEEFVTNLVTLEEGEYNVVEPPKKIILKRPGGL